MCGIEAGQDTFDFFRMARTSNNMDVREINWFVSSVATADGKLLSLCGNRSLLGIHGLEKPPESSINTVQPEFWAGISRGVRCGLK